MLLEKDENSDVCGNVRLLLVGPFFSLELSFDFGHFSGIMPRNKEKSLKFMLQKSNAIVNVIAFGH